MKVYGYHYQSGFFTKEKEVDRVPSFATTTKPPKKKKGTHPKWEAGKWVLAPYLEGTYYQKATGQVITIGMHDAIDADSITEQAPSEELTVPVWGESGWEEGLIEKEIQAT